MKLHQFKALTFDCYGTLIDWETGILKGLLPLTSKISPQLSTDEILQSHSKNEATQQAEKPTMLYRKILENVYCRLANDWGISVTADEAAAYGNSIGNWPVFSDTPPALRYLKKHYSLFILSNVDNRSFAASNRRLGVEFDGIYTAEDIGSYKPDDRNFEYLIGRLGDLGIEKNEILHTAESLFHDHVPANRHRLKSCWIHRRHGKKGSAATVALDETPRYDFRFESIAEMAAAHLSEITDDNN